MLKIACDLDGCLKNLMASVILTYQEDYDSEFELKESDITDWDIAKFFPIGKKIYDFAFKEYAWEVFYSNAEPYKGARLALKQLKKEGHHITILTYQNKYSFDPSAHWLSFNEIPFDELRIMINDTSKEGHGKEDTDYDLYLEDSAKNIEKLLKKGKKVIGMRRPWNQDYTFEEYHNIWWISDISQLPTMVKSIEEAMNKKTESEPEYKITRNAIR